MDDCIAIWESAPVSLRLLNIGFFFVYIGFLFFLCGCLVFFRGVL